MTQSFYDRVAGELNDIDAQGLTKPERIIASVSYTHLTLPTKRIV